MTSDSSKPDDATEPARLLSGIACPEDVQALESPQLLELAEEIREKLISTLARTGGHLGPNLGVVELTIALHRVFNTPKDKFVMDVSHQGYVHKMLTGRAPQIGSIRQYEGLNGFLLRTESEHDCYGAGHAGTALSAALGMAAGRDLKGGDEHVIAVAGDAAFTCGPTLEALNNIASTAKRFIISPGGRTQLGKRPSLSSMYTHHRSVNTVAVSAVIVIRPISCGDPPITLLQTPMVIGVAMLM